MKNGKYTLVIAPEGYIGKKYRNRYAYEHIVEFWKKENRMPKDGWVVHHKDGNHRNNVFENLEEMEKGTHSKEHLTIKEITHGSDNGYRKGCRCDLCKAWKAASTLKYKIARN